MANAELAQEVSLTINLKTKKRKILKNYLLLAWIVFAKYDDFKVDLTL